MSEIQEILEKHKMWLNGEGEGGRCANFRGADLRGVDFRGADLRAANFQKADLRGVDFRWTDLRAANFQKADLRRTDFRGADLQEVNFQKADLRWADLRWTDLRYADLRWTDLRYADLCGADLANAVYTEAILNLQCPEEGSFIAWKRLRQNMIAKLLIPEDAKRSSATLRKCRASKAIVLAIYDADGTEISEGRSQHDGDFIYRVGETIYPDSWDEDRWNECSNGIHFFITRREAEEY